MNKPRLRLSAGPKFGCFTKVVWINSLKAEKDLQKELHVME